MSGPERGISYVETQEAFRAFSTQYRAEKRQLHQPPTFLDGLRHHARRMKRLFGPSKTRSPRWRD